MATKNSITVFLLLLLFAATVSARGRGGGDGLCAGADYKPLCRSVIRGISNPAAATAKTIEVAMAQAKIAKVISTRIHGGRDVQTCTEMYVDIVDNLGIAMSCLRKGDKGGLNINLSSVFADIEACEDDLNPSSAVRPILQANSRLRQLASNSLALAQHIH